MRLCSHLRQYLPTFFLEKTKTHISSSITFFLKSCRLWDNVKIWGESWGSTNDVTIWRILDACWISKATWTHEHAHSHAPGHTHAYAYTQICNIYCFSIETMFHERVSMLRYTYTACLVCTSHVCNCSFSKTPIFTYKIFAGYSTPVSVMGI